MQRISQSFQRSVRFIPATTFVAIFIGLAAFLALPPHPVAAINCSATVTVTTDGDSGAGSLRQAISDICAGGTINFAASLTSSGPATITLTGSELGISKNMTITGPGPDLLAVSGGGVSRVFNISAGVNATIDGLTIRDGSVSGNGGGILNAGVLTVTNSALLDNSVLSTGNRGGAIYSAGPGRQMILANSFVAGNTSSERGGGIYVESSALAVTNTTFYSNTSITHYGGALATSSAVVAVTNSTFSSNSSPLGGGAIRTSAGVVTLTNTIIQKSLAGGNCNGPVTDGGSNISDDNTCGLTAATSFKNTNPQLSPLGEYGGDTQTLAPLPGSPAIDLGVTGSCPTTDQRGVVRLLDSCDSGAFESQGFTLVITGGSPQTTTVTSAFAEPLTVTVSSAFTEPVGPGGVLLFTPPASGAGLSITDPFTAATDANGLAASGVITANAVGGSYGVTATVGSGSVDVTACGGSPCGGATEAVFALTNQCNATDTVTTTDDDGTGSLRRAMLTLCAGGTIGFDASLTSGGPATITLTSGELGISKNMTITGPGPNLLAVSGNNATRIFNVSAGVNATIDGLAIRDGAASNSGDYGGGILNSGVLTVTDSAFYSNTTAGLGGAIQNTGASAVLTVTGVLFTGNSAGSRGGGLSNFNGRATVQNCAFVSNSAGDGGGGAYNQGNLPLTIINSTFQGNSGGSGGGGGIYSSWAQLMLVNSTLAGNSASYSGNIGASMGGITLTNTIVGPGAAGGSCSLNPLTDGGGNIDAGAECGFTDPTSLSSTDPLLAPLTFNADTWVFPLLPGSPAIDTGVFAACPEKDQRGMYRSAGASCDSGAFESQGFSLLIASGSPQTATIGSAFAEPLAVTVTSPYSEPVGPGGVVTFTPPAEGAGLDVTAPFTAATDANGLAASGMITANTVAGSYAVTPTVRGEGFSAGAFNGGATPAVFDLTNRCNLTDTVTSTDDSGTGTLRQAIRTLCTGGVIDFAPALTASGPNTITLTSSELDVKRNLTILGPGADRLAVSGGGVLPVFTIWWSVDDATISGLTIRDGYAEYGGGLVNAGVLTVTEMIFTGNVANDDGGAIMNDDTLTVIDSTFDSNSAGDDNGAGGAIFSVESLLTVRNSVFTANSALYGGALADDEAEVTIEASAFLTNSASDGGGAIDTAYSELWVANSTFSGNSTSSEGGGGIYVYNSEADVANSTFSANSAPVGSAVYADNDNGSELYLYNTVMAQNSGDNCGGAPLDWGGNLEDGASCGFDTADGSWSNTDALLAPLQLSQGAWVLPLLPGSPAIDGGDNSDCPVTDQRGVLRQQGACDSGAFESQGFSLSIAGGSPQTTTITSAFAEPLSATVSSAFGEPVGPGGVITFTPPATGAGLDVTNPFTAATAADGLATSGAVTANEVTGSYGVTATIGGGGFLPTICGGGSCGGVTEVVFDLTNDRITPAVALASQPNPSFFSQPVLVVATVTTDLPGAPAPTGVVTFTAGAEVLGVSSVDGSSAATLAVYDLAVGDYTIAAIYGGDESFYDSAAQAITQVVDMAPTRTSLEAEPNPAMVGENVIFDVQVQLDLPEPAALAFAPSPSGQLVITDTSGVIDLIGWVVNGKATVSGGAIPAGEYTVYARYLGDDELFAGSTSEPMMLVVEKQASVTAMESSSNPAYVDQPLAFTVNVAEFLPDAVRLLGLVGPSGAVVITDTSGVLNLGGELVNGEVVLPAQLAEGTYTLTATYLGDTRYATSASTALVQVVARHATETALSVTPMTAKVGETVQFLAAVSRLDPAVLISGGPSGAVEFFANGATLGSALLVNGQATLSVPATSAGVFTITAIYNGDSVYAQSISAAVTLTVTRRDTATALTIAPNPAKARQDVILTAAVAELVADAGVTAATVPLQPGGEVIFRSAGAELGRAGLANGQATLRIATLPVGQHVVVAEYGGDDAFAGSASAPVTLTIQPMPLAVNDAAGAQGGPVTIDVTANDLDPAGGGLTILSVTAPGHGSATIVPGGPNVIYTPAAGFTGTDSFTYVIEDANGNRDDALVAVVVTYAPEGQGQPQVQAVNPSVASSATFTTPSATVGVQAPAGFYTGTLGEKDILFISFTPVITPSQQTNNPPANLRFGNLEFNLSVYLNNQLLEGQAFAKPLVVTIDYDPALLGGLNAETLGLWYWNGTAWSTDGIIILSNDVTNHTVTIAISHLSQFAFFAAAPTGLDPGDEPLRLFNLYLPAMNK